MRSYDGESSSGDEDDRRDILADNNLNQGTWRGSTHPPWAWEHRVRIFIFKNIINR